MTSPRKPRNLKLVTPATANQGERVLTDVHAFLGRYMAYTIPEQSDAVALWVAHTYATGAADASPRLSIQSAEKQSGKTRLLELLDLVVHSPLSVASISASAMFRVISDEQMDPTLLIDEADTIFSKNGTRSEELRGVLNAGYRRSGSIVRVVGGEVKRFPVFAPVAMAGIGELPDTVQDRSIVIRLKRRRVTDRVEPLRRREVEPEAREMRARIQAWAEDNELAFANTIAHVPPGLSDRAVDIWEPLFAIAQCAGGSWPERATLAAIALSAGRKTERSDGARVLSDVRRVLTRAAVERIPSADLARAVAELEDGAYSGPMRPRDIAKLLAPFDITPKTLRVRGKRQTVRGYETRDFTDAFLRYLPAEETQ